MWSYHDIGPDKPLISNSELDGQLVYSRYGLDAHLPVHSMTSSGPTTFNVAAPDLTAPQMGKKRLPWSGHTLPRQDCPSYEGEPVRNVRQPT